MMSIPTIATDRPALITGGAGFIGTNLAFRLLAAGKPVIIFDNLGRPGVERNLEALHAAYAPLLSIHIADIRDQRALSGALAQADQVFHCAAQVAVTTSLSDPFTDFEINARGTLNLLEALRAMENPPSLIFTSTNKVYGALPDIVLQLKGDHYEPADPHLRSNGISEQRPLDFHSPYGCSKGAADQYVIDYARTFGLPAVIFRMSCIYGPHQHGNEDQGWVAHFLIRTLKGRSITIYGDGKQVRDVLFIDDLVDAMLLAQANIRSLTGRSFNIGGGPANTLSLLELLGLIGRIQGVSPAVSFEMTRPGDQRFYVSDIGAFSQATGWRPTVTVAEGLERLHRWLVESRSTMAV